MFPCRFRVDYALSREQKNKKGGKMYIQDKVEEYADEVFDLLDNGAHIYFCGLKGMMPGMPALAARTWFFASALLLVPCRYGCHLATHGMIRACIGAHSCVHLCWSVEHSHA